MRTNAIPEVCRFCKDGPYLYGITREEGWFIRINTGNQTWNILDEVTNYSDNVYRAYDYVAKFDKNIFLFPSNDKKNGILKYSIQDDSWEKIKSPQDIMLYRLYLCDYEYERLIVYSELNYFFIFNLKTSHIEKIYRCDVPENAFIRECVYNDGKVFSILSNGSIYVYEVAEQIGYSIDIDLTENSIINSIQIIDNNLWVSFGNNRIIILDSTTLRIKRTLTLNVEKDICEVDIDPFYYFLHRGTVGKYVFYIKYKSKEMILINKDDFTIKYICVDYCKTKNTNGRNLLPYFYYSYVRDDSIILYDRKLCIFIEINTSDWSTKEINLSSCENVLVFYQKLVKNGKILMEESPFEKEMFCEFLRTKE